MLVQYQQTVRRLVGNDQTFASLNDFDLRDWINIARGQIALEGEAIRTIGSVSTVANQQSYSFSNITLTTSGVSGTLTVRQLAVVGLWLAPREWEWFFLYVLGQPALPAGAPFEWSQLGQGSAGSLYLNPTPAAVSQMVVDVVALPSPLSTDADPEALPYPWQDAVPYFAAYMAYLQQGDQDQAAKYYALFERFMMRARSMSVPTVLPRQYEGGAAARDAATHVGIMPATGQA